MMLLEEKKNLILSFVYEGQLSDEVSFENVLFNTMNFVPLRGDFVRMLQSCLFRVV